MTKKHQFWVAPALLFATFIVYLLVVERQLLFGHFLLPVGDNAADDLLVVDAKRLHLLHGNYSRFGFYHPGPWFILVMAAGEYMFYDWTGWFRSYFGAQIFTLSLLQGVALAFTCRLWLLVTDRISLALLATLIIATVMLVQGEPVNVFLQPWIPYATMAAALMAATGLAGTLLRGQSWLALLTLGSAQMLHGHASFLGILPLLLGLALLLAWLTGQLTRPRTGPLALSVVIAALYAAPVLLHVILHWPGEFLLYWDFLGTQPSLPFNTAAQYEAGFIPIGGLWLLLFLLPEPHGELRRAGLVVFAAAALPAIWYAWREVDDRKNEYLLLWLPPFVGTSLVAALLHGLRATELTRIRHLLVCTLLSGLILSAIAGVPNRLFIMDGAANLLLQHQLTAVLAVPPPAGVAKVELVVDQGAAWVPAWTETTDLLAVAKRAGRHEFCISPDTWHLLFEQANRCDPQHDPIIRRYRVTFWPDHPPSGSFRLDQSGMIPIPISP